MLAMFNVTALSDFGYPETTHFINPMEIRYRAKPCKPDEYKNTTSWGNGEFSRQGVEDKLQWFVNLDAYKDMDNIELALEEYWGRTSLVHSLPSTSTAALITPVSNPPTTLTTLRSVTTSPVSSVLAICAGKGKGNGNCR